MTLFQTDFAKGNRVIPVTAGCELIHLRMPYVLTAALVAADVIDFGMLPADHIPVDWAVENDDADTGTTLTATLGVLNAAKTAIDSAAANGGNWLNASTALQAAAFTRLSAQSVAVQTAIARMSSIATNRSLGILFPAGGAGGVGSIIALHLWYRAGRFGN